MGTGARAAAAAAVILRRATSADVEAMHRIEAASFGDPWSRHALQSAVEARNIAVTVAAGDASDATVLGYSVVVRVADEAELLNLAVAPEGRRSGVGSALLEGVVSDARGWGVRNLFLEVRHGNAAARALYQLAGFEEVGRRSGYYRHPTEDALILRKTLDQPGVSRRR